MFSLTVLVALLLAVKIITATPPHYTQHLPDVDHDSVPEELTLIQRGDQQSLISKEDIMYLIENIAEKLNIKENLMSTIDETSALTRDKYMEQLTEFQERVKDRPNHLFHILEDIANLREKLQPNISDIENNLQELDVLEKIYQEIAENSEMLQIQFQKYQIICIINCGPGPDYFHKGIYPTFNDNLVSFKLKDLNEYITVMLKKFVEEFEQTLLEKNSLRDTAYAEIFTNLKNDLKRAAVKKFGMTMYNILTLQDDYIHFAEDLNKTDIPCILRDIETNSALIKLLLLGLKEDVKKYGEYCLSCNTPKYLRHGIHGSIWKNFNNGDYQYPSDDTHELSNEDYEGAYKVVHELIQSKIQELCEIIESHFYDLFAELDEELINPDIIGWFNAYLQPIQEEIDNAIAEEQNALEKLKNSIPISSLLRLLTLSAESKQTLQNLVAIQEFLDDNM